MFISLEWAYSRQALAIIMVHCDNFLNYYNFIADDKLFMMNLSGGNWVGAGRHLQVFCAKCPQILEKVKRKNCKNGLHLRISALALDRDNSTNTIISLKNSLKVVGNEKEGGSGKWQMIDIGLGLW